MSVQVLSLSLRATDRMSAGYVESFTLTVLIMPQIHEKTVTQ